MDRPRSLASPVDFKPYRGGASGKCVHVVIETARGDRNKMAYDEELGVFRLKKVLPEGMTFPYDFGFVPSTLAEDGDPLDALVLMDEPGTMGCLVDCRIIGVILGEQSEGRRKLRNDRLIVVAEPSHTHADLKRVADLNATLLDELEKFFVNYHGIDGEKYKIVGCKGPGKARKLVAEAARRWTKREKKQEKKQEKKDAKAGKS
jgi:inorganic pyrophosphatase